MPPYPTAVQKAKRHMLRLQKISLCKPQDEKFVTLLHINGLSGPGTNLVDQRVVILVVGLETVAKGFVMVRQIGSRA
jgi:hypothetical protein